MHTRRHRAQQVLYEYFSTLAAKCGFALFDYGDWEWERPGERVLDIREAAHGNPEPYEVLPARINDETLLRMWSACRVLAIVNPPGLHELKAGAQHELAKLPAFFAKRRNAPTPIPIVLNLGHDCVRAFRGIPLAYTLSSVNVDDPLGCENAFALVALAWLIHGVERSGDAGRSVLATSSTGNELLDALFEARRLRLRAPIDIDQRSDVTEAGARLERFWDTKARAVRAWFSKAHDECACVRAGRTFIAAIESRS